MADQRIREQLDSFRVGHDDGKLAELKDAAETLEQDGQLQADFQRSQALDRSIQAALDDARIPEGLEDQLLRLTGLSEPVMGSTEIEEEATAAIKDGSVVPSSADQRKYLRRGVWCLYAAALAGAILLVAYAQRPEDKPLLGSEIAELINQEAGTWTSDTLSWSRDLAPTSHPIDPTVKMDSATWTTVNALGDSQAIVLRRTLRRGNVYLLVAKATARGVGAAPPLPPQWNTGNRRIGVWANLGNVYVLVVEGDIDDYKKMIREPYAA